MARKSKTARFAVTNLAEIILELRRGQCDLNVTVPAAITNVLAAAVGVDRTSLAVLFAAEGSGAKARDVRAELVDVAATLILLILVAGLPQFPALLLLLPIVIVIVIVVLLCHCLGCSKQPE